MAPASRASSTSRDGRSARAVSWAGERVPPSSRPPLTTRLGCVREKSRSALATALTSPWTKAIAVGPVSRLPSGSCSLPAMASRTRVFL